jgi:hypothetical protein
MGINYLLAFRGGEAVIRKRRVNFKLGDKAFCHFLVDQISWRKPVAPND